jgi:hypothetical protein
LTLTVVLNSSCVGQSLLSPKIRPFETSMSRGGSKKKKARSAARTARADRQGSPKRPSDTGPNMSSARVDDDINVADGGTNSSDSAHIEPNVIINPGSHSSGSGSSQTSSAGTNTSSNQSQTPPPRGDGSEQEQSDANNQGNQSQTGCKIPGSTGSQLNANPGGGAGGDRPGGSAPDSDRDSEREQAIATALELVEETHDIMQLSGSIRLAGQSKLDAKRLLDKIKNCVVTLMSLRIPSDDEIFPALKQARRDMQRLLMQADEHEARSSTTAASPTRPSADESSLSQAHSSPEQPRETGSGLRYTLAMKQLDCEITRLRSSRLIGVEVGTDVKPDILKDLLKVDVPDVIKAVDRARDALKTLSLVAGAADEAKILDAQDACEAAIAWIALVEERCKTEQLHLDVKQQPREVDFVPFQPGAGVSIYEFFNKFETWSRGRMSLDQRANLLYHRHLDSSVTDGNKELEDAKEDYQRMKSLLIEKWGVPDIVCDQYLENIKGLTMPTDPKDKTGLLTYTKNAYSNLVTLTKLEIDRGQKVPGLEEYYLSNQFLKKLHRTMPEELANKFLFQLQERDESYHLMKGRVFLDRIISLLKCAYKTLEIVLEETPEPVMAAKVKPVKQISMHAVTAFNGYTSSSSSDDQDAQTNQTRQKGKKLKSPHTSGPTSTAVATLAATASPLGCQESEDEQTGQQSAWQFAPNVLPRPKTLATSVHQLQTQPTTAPQLGQSSTTHLTSQFCRGPRWACPVRGHTGHDLADCQEFWSAQDGASRRRMIFGSGCPSCLGKDQGCRDGRCDIIYQLPTDVVCGSCVKSCPPGKSPSNKMTCDVTWHRNPPVNVLANVMEAWVPNLTIGRLVQKVIMSANMFHLNMVGPSCNSPSTRPAVQSQRAEFSRECVPSDYVRRVVMLEDELAELRKQLHEQGNKISGLASSCAEQKASCKTADAAIQTDPTPTEEVQAAAAVIMKDAGCDAWSDRSKNEDVTLVPQHIDSKKKRKPRKNRSRGARSRAKAAALAKLNSDASVPEAEAAASALPTPDPPAPVTETVATSALSLAEAAALVLPTNDNSVPAAVTAEEDRRCVILPEKARSLDYTSQPIIVNLKNLFQGFCPPLVDPYRLSRWFQVASLDLRMWHI